MWSNELFSFAFLFYLFIFVCFHLVFFSFFIFIVIFIFFSLFFSIHFFKTPGLFLRRNGIQLVNLGGNKFCQSWMFYWFDSEIYNVACQKDIQRSPFNATAWWVVLQERTNLNTFFDKTSISGWEKKLTRVRASEILQQFGQCKWKLNN